ncbi:MAG: ComEC/Rec2 family competence protein [Ignavibacteriales bacterium]|nr:ComEC/Rec2 family competence protein [Ignavibacteriales bacterium]
MREIKKLYPEKFAYFIKGILLADRSDIDYETKNSFTNTGVIHVLAVSGLHVGFIGIILFLLLGRFNIRLKYILTIFGILLFLVINNGQPSIFRASTMAVLFLIAKLTGRSTNGFNSIAIAGFIILILNPNELFNPGFLLSFSAVLSILILYPIFAKTINKYQLNSIIKKILLFMSVSFAAQIGTLPFTVFYFNKLSLIALFANLFVIPVLGIILAIAILSLAASVASMFIGLIIAEANIFLISTLYYFINRLSELSFSFIPIYSFSIVDGIIFYLSFGVILIIISNVQSTFKVVSAVILILFCSAFAFKLDKNTLLPEGELSVLTIDVGQGDSF